ncbi:MAG: type II toxin-antitoxin system VapB family antitoxin [Acaryochloridaceae cyanobacterium RU_4_10]|nr:type II toxin-antitoxin system VapB family antitoxin [Acaryochloridaceae cyanobacterium RU_4_10]
MRTNVDLDDTLVEEAFRLTTAKTKKELLNQALQALIQTRKKKNLLDLAGKIQFADDYDYKALRANRHAVD